MKTTRQTTQQRKDGIEEMVERKAIELGLQKILVVAKPKDPAIRLLTAFEFAQMLEIEKYLGAENRGEMLQETCENYWAREISCQAYAKGGIQYG